MSTSADHSVNYLANEQQRLRVVMVSKALVTGVYQRKAEEIARLGIDLTVFTPPYWRDRRGDQVAESLHTSGYRLATLPTVGIGDYHLHNYPTLKRRLSLLRPHVLHMDEEPYNLATWVGLRGAVDLGIAGTFFTWQNINRTYPPPFAQMEQWVYRNTPEAIAGSSEAASVLRAKGYAGRISEIPQFGVDTDLYSCENHQPYNGTLRIGYAGALLPEKGVDLLLRACGQLQGAWQLSVFGEGEERPALERLAGELGIADRVRFLGRRQSSAMPACYRGLDVLVLPSRTTPTWKEQFGRVLPEAMASGVVVIGSNSGEIPNVIGDAGIVFPEEDLWALANALQQVADAPRLREELAARGRRRVLERYTMQSIARETVALYRRLAALSTR